MATYNGERFLPEQLASLARQNHPISELIVTDDGSSDTTLQVVASFAKNAPFPVRIERNDARLGFRGNFMKAASLCTSDLIAFCDQDDVWHPNKIDVAAKYFADPNVVLVHHNANIVTSDGTKIGLLCQTGQFPAITEPLRSDPWIVSNGFTQVFRRRLIDFSDLWPMSIDPNSPNNRMAHDQWYFLIASTFGIVEHIGTPLVDYRQHGQNTFGWRKRYNYIARVPLWFEDRSGVYARCSLAAKRRVKIMQSAATRLEPTWRNRAESAAELYQLLSDLYDLRTQLYNEQNIVNRLKKFKQLADSNAYNSLGRYTFSGKGLVKDFILAVVLGPVLKARGFEPAAGDPTCRIVRTDK